jgi:predicted MarR family transcription regulator
LASAKEGKENLFSVTDTGVAFCERYAAIRCQLLVADGMGAVHDDETLSQIAAILRALSGQYNQAARAAATL